MIIGARSAGSDHFDGYLAELYLVDGTALVTSDVVSQTGQIVPAAYAGSLGTNGFYLGFQDNVTQVANLDTRLHLRTVSNEIKDHSNQAHQVQSMGTTQVKSGVGNPHDNDGASIFFDGQNSYLTLPDHPGFHTSDQRFTLESWDYLTTATSVIYAGQYENDINYNRLAVSTSGVSYTSLGGSGGVDYSILNAGALNVGQWHHVAVQRTNDAFLVYVDGEDVTSTASSSLSFYNQAFGDQNQPFLVGFDGTTTRWVIFTMRWTAGDNLYFLKRFSPQSPRYRRCWQRQQ